MSLSVYSAQPAEANRLRFDGLEFYYDQEQDTVIIKTGKDQVYFNTLYNKEEVDQLIAGLTLQALKNGSSTELCCILSPQEAQSG